MTRKSRAGLFVLAMLLFLLPWMAAESEGTKYVVSGADLVVGHDVTDSRGDPREVDPQPLAIAVLALAAAGVALSLSKGQKGI